MAEKTKDIQGGGIVFGDWKLFPVDASNWELCHRHATPSNRKSKEAGTAGEIKWFRCGRFHQYNTLGNALRYAANVELGKGHESAVSEIADAIKQLDQVLADFSGRLADALDQQGA